MTTPGQSAKHSLAHSFLPWTVDSDAMEGFLDIDLTHIANNLACLEDASQWRRSKVAELGVVNVVGALIAAVVSSAFTWPATDQASWTVLATFYGALIMSLVAVSTASQQCIILYRLGETRIALQKLQKLLRSSRKTSQPNRMQKYLWQVPIMLLNVSVLVFLVGLMILVWDRAAAKPSWDNDMKIAFVASLAGIFGFTNYMLGMFLLYRRDRNPTHNGCNEL